MAGQGWKWSDVWSFFQGLGGLAVAVAAVAAGIRFLRDQFGRPTLIVQYWSDANTLPPHLLTTIRGMVESGLNVLSSVAFQGPQYTESQRFLMGANSDILKALRNWSFDRVDVLHAFIQNASQRTVSGVHLSLGGAVMQVLEVTIDGTFVTPEEASHFRSGVQSKTEGPLLPALPAIPAGSDLRLAIYGIVDPYRIVSVQTDEGLRVRTHRLVRVPYRRLLQRSIRTWDLS